MIRDTLERLNDPVVVALCIAGDAWPRSFVAATLIPDKWIALVERPDGRRWLVPAGEEPKAGREDRLLLVRNRPITVPLSATHVLSADEFECNAACEVLVRWATRDDDLAALRRTLLDSGELTLSSLAHELAQAGGETALRELIQQRSAAQLVHGDLRAQFQAALADRLQRFLFSSGATLEGVPNARFTSPAWSRHETLQRETASRVRQIESRQLVAHAALSATRRRLEDLSAILEKLKLAASAGPRMQWHDLLPALAPAERGRLLEQLWRLTPDRTIADAVVLAAANQCVWLSPQTPDQVARRTELDERLGGLRSISFCPQRNWLLVGAATGVWALGAADGEIRGVYSVPNAGQPRTGFNAATLSGDRLFASHSQLGVWSWPLDQPDARAELRFAPIEGLPKTIRSVIAADDGRIIFTADERVQVLDLESLSDEIAPLAAGRDELSPAAPAVLQCLAREGRTLYAGTVDGDLLALDSDHPDAWVTVHRAGLAFESIHPRRWNDLLELVIPAGRTVLGIFAQEGLVARLLESGAMLRRAWACDDLLVALSDYRDRLVFLPADRPGREGHDVPIARMLGHTVQDACIVTRSAGEQSAPA